jgi:hypothetical protein
MVSEAGKERPAQRAKPRPAKLNDEMIAPANMARLVATALSSPRM